jgi:Protein of unknown function (DUF3423).
MTTLSVRLSDSLVEQAHLHAKISLRPMSKQIEYWAMLGKLGEENPDLPVEFIKEALFAKLEIENGDVSTFEFRS